MFNQMTGAVNMIVFVSIGFAAFMTIIAIVIVVRLFRNSARNQHLIQNGVPATAVVLELHDTGMTINDNPQVELVLDVLPANRPPFRATTRTMISRLHTSQVQPGMQVLVKYDPSDPSKIALAGFTGAA